MEKVNACPFCGHEPFVEDCYVDGLPFGNGWVSCDNEDCSVQPDVDRSHGPAPYGWSNAERIAVWNAITGPHGALTEAAALIERQTALREAASALVASAEVLIPMYGTSIIDTRDGQAEVIIPLDSFENLKAAFAAALAGEGGE